MKVSILGNGLTSLTLAKALVNLDINVDIYSDKKITKYSKIQTLGISKTNIDFFNEFILDIKNLLWDIEKIEIFSEKLNNEKILNFQKKNKHLFSIVRNYDLYNRLLINLKKNKLVKFKKSVDYQKLLEKNYKLIFNCEPKNLITKRFFYKKFKKNYNSFAHITTFNHKPLNNNHVASQVFTKKGPLAFLPLSKKETSIVYSIKGKNKENLIHLINKYNTKYKILKIKDFLCFKLESSNLRSYYYKNIIAFGDLLHKIHPLAGQGFNMTIRDVKEVYKLIQSKKECGLDLDISICSDFEKNTKDKNYLFSNGIDLIYEFFNFESKINNNTLSKSLKFLGKNKVVNKFFTKFADTGMKV